MATRGLKSNKAWLPIIWQPEAQIEIIDELVGKINLWLQVIRGIAHELANASSVVTGGEIIEYADGTYDRYGAEYEGCWREDFLELLKPIVAWDLYGQYSIPHMKYGYIRMSCPEPYSRTLASLEYDLAELSNCAKELFFSRDFYNLYVGWNDINEYEDPAWTAHDLAVVITQFIEKVENENIPAILGVRSAWQEEVLAIEGILYENWLSYQRNTEQGQQTFQALRLAKSVHTIASIGKVKIEQALEKRSIEEIRSVSSLLLKALSDAKNTNGITDEDVESIAVGTENLKDILSDNQDVTRSLASTSELKADALIVLDNIKHYWGKKMKQLSTDYAGKSKVTFAGLPAYRYKVGDMVKINKSGKVGKIVGVEKEGGNGKQVYRVRVDGEDNFKNLYLNDIVRA